MKDDLKLRACGIYERHVHFGITINGVILHRCSINPSERLDIEKWMKERDMYGYSFSPSSGVICRNPDDATLLFLGWS